MEGHADESVLEENVFRVQGINGEALLGSRSDFFVL